jgi:hypothetical protein
MIYNVRFNIGKSYIYNNACNSIVNRYVCCFMVFYIPYRVMRSKISNYYLFSTTKKLWRTGSVIHS